MGFATPGRRKADVEADGPGKGAELAFKKAEDNVYEVVISPTGLSKFPKDMTLAEAVELRGLALHTGAVDAAVDAKAMAQRITAIYARCPNASLLLVRDPKGDDEQPSFLQLVTLPLSQEELAQRAERGEPIHTPESVALLAETLVRWKGAKLEAAATPGTSTLVLAQGHTVEGGARSAIVQQLGLDYIEPIKD